MRSKMMLAVAVLLMGATACDDRSIAPAGVDHWPGYSPPPSVGPVDYDAEIYSMPTDTLGSGFYAQYVNGPSAPSMEAYVNEVWNRTNVNGSDVLGINTDTAGGYSAQSLHAPALHPQWTNFGTPGQLRVTAGFRYGYVAGCISRNTYYHVTRIAWKGVGEVMDLHFAMWPQNGMTCWGVYDSVSSSPGVCTCSFDDSSKSIRNSTRWQAKAIVEQAIDEDMNRNANPQLGELVAQGFGQALKVLATGMTLYAAGMTIEYSHF